MKKYFIELINNTTTSFKGKNLLWHLLAIGLTFLIVVSGLDWAYYVATRGEVANILGMTAGMLGFIVPVTLPLILYVLGAMRKDQKLKDAGKYVFQAVVVSWIIIAFYKALTGRLPPNAFSEVAGVVDNSRGWNFGFFKNGIFWGWPSHHTGVSFALAVFLANYFKEQKFAKLLLYVFAFTVGIGASMSFHWLSEAVAGLIVGWLVGYTVYESTLKS